MKAIVLGAGGHARVVLAMLAATGDYDVAGVVDTDTPRPGEIILGVPVLGGINQLTELRNTGVEAAFVAIGDGAARAKAQATLASEGYALPPLVHPSAFISPNVHLGAGATGLCASVRWPRSRARRWGSHQYPGSCRPRKSNRRFCHDFASCDYRRALHHRRRSLPRARGQSEPRANDRRWGAARGWRSGVSRCSAGRACCRSSRSPQRGSRKV